MRVGIICEGSTDFVVLQAIAAQVLRSRHPTFSLLAPDFDALTRPSGAKKPATGWQAVRSFLKAGNIQLARLDLVIVQVDASIRHLEAVGPHLEGGGLDSLCEHVKGWIGGSVPATTVITLPREEIETWLVATHTHRKNVEAIVDPAGVLAEAGLVQTRRGKPDKTSKRYGELVRALAGRLSDERWMRSVPERQRLCSKLRRSVRRRPPG